MPQLSLYMDEPTMCVLRERSACEGVSLSKFVGNLIRKDASGDKWPQGYWSVYGALNDDSFTVPNELDERLDGSLPSFD